jgi:hypothetical protein
MAGRRAATVRADRGAGQRERTVTRASPGPTVSRSRQNADAEPEAWPAVRRCVPCCRAEGARAWAARITLQDTSGWVSGGLTLAYSSGRWSRPTRYEHDGLLSSVVRMAALRALTGLWGHGATTSADRRCTAFHGASELVAILRRADRRRMYPRRRRRFALHPRSAISDHHVAERRRPSRRYSSPRARFHVEHVHRTRSTRAEWGDLLPSWDMRTWRRPSSHPCRFLAARTSTVDSHRRPSARRARFHVEHGPPNRPTRAERGDLLTNWDMRTWRRPSQPPAPTPRRAEIDGGQSSCAGRQTGDVPRETTTGTPTASKRRPCRERAGRVAFDCVRRRTSRKC